MFTHSETNHTAERKVFCADFKAVHIIDGDIYNGFGPGCDLKTQIMEKWV